MDRFPHFSGIETGERTEHVKCPPQVNACLYMSHDESIVWEYLKHVNIYWQYLRIVHEGLYWKGHVVKNVRKH